MDGKSFEALMPREMASKAEDVGVTKARLGTLPMLALAVLAGSFIAMGANLATIVSTGSASIAYGLARLATGLAFSLGLILVVVAGAELFTGNNLIIMAWASRKITTRALLRNWLIVYCGNFMGAVLTAWMVFLSGQHTLNDGAVGLTMLKIADYKCSLDLVPALLLGAFCNALVCLAVWLCFSARTTTDRILSIIPPITAFVAAGFEHSVANMYFIPLGLLVKHFDGDLPARLGVKADGLTLSGFLFKNLLPVTLGNIIGGSLMVGLFYWFIYLRPCKAEKPPGGFGEAGRPDNE